MNIPLIIWAAYEATIHVNREDNYGVWCDERGCAICNADSKVDAALGLLAAALDPSLWYGPDDDEIVDAMNEWQFEMENA